MQVLTYLNYAAQGSIVRCIRDFSPALSDSLNSSAPDSHGSQDEARTNDRENLIAEPSDIKCRNKISDSPSIQSATKAMFTKRSSISLFFGEGGPSNSRKSRERKRGTTPTKREVFYNEMVPSYEKNGR